MTYDRPLGGRTAPSSRSLDASANQGPTSEDPFAAREHVVQRILKMRGALGELASHLVDVFLVALLDFLAKELAQRAVAQTFAVFVGEVRDDVGDQCARESLGLDVGVVGEEGIDRRTRAWSGGSLDGRGNARRGRGTGSRRSGGAWSERDAGRRRLRRRGRGMPNGRRRRSQRPRRSRRPRGAGSVRHL